MARLVIYKSFKSNGFTFEALTKLAVDAAADAASLFYKDGRIETHEVQRATALAMLSLAISGLVED